MANPTASASQDELPPQIHDCFEQKLPTLDDSPVAYKLLSSASGKTTQAQELPYALIQLKEDNWNAEGYEALQKARQLQTTVRQELRTAGTFPELQLRSETDVVAASAIYVIGPITEILHTLYPGAYNVHNEWSEVTFENKSQNDKPEKITLESAERPTKRKRGAGPANKQKVETAEKKEPDKQAISTVRLDLCWKRKDNDEYIAVLEFKKRGQILEGDYEPAIIRPGTKGLKGPKGVNARVKALGKDLERREEETHLEHNAKWHTKQVAAYAMKTQCEYVALFNWEHLLLFNWKYSDFAEQTIGDRANFTWVKDNKEARIRLALLGWLNAAFKAKGFKPEEA